MGVLALSDNLTVMEKNLSTTSLSLRFATHPIVFCRGTIQNLNSKLLKLSFPLHIIVEFLSEHITSKATLPACLFFPQHLNSCKPTRCSLVT